MEQNVRDIYVSSLRNTHALETEALQIIRRQLERVEAYPEMAQLLRRHEKETEQQQARLAKALESLSESPSTLKEGFMGIMGNLAALAHAPASDEILKNTFANLAFENYEIAAYESLIVIAKAAGETQFVPDFEQSLREERATADEIARLVAPTTQKFVELSIQGRKADR